MNNVGHPLSFVKSCTCFSNLPGYIPVMWPPWQWEMWNTKGTTEDYVFLECSAKITPACLCVLTVSSFFMSCTSSLCRWRGTGLMPASASLPMAGCWNPTPPKRNLCVSEHRVWLTESPQGCMPLLFPNKKASLAEVLQRFVHSCFSTLSPISLVSVGPQAVCTCKSSWHSFLKISANGK